MVFEVPLSPPGLVSSADLYGCQSCRVDEWAPARSEACFNCTVEFLSWSEPISWALLIPTVLLMLLMAGLAILFALNTSTPVVKSVGRKMCFLMLASLACACSSLFCYSGESTRHTCLLQLPLCHRLHRLPLMHGDTLLPDHLHLQAGRMLAGPLRGVGASPAQKEGTEGLFQGMHQLQVDDSKPSFWAFKISPGCGGICLGCGERTGTAGRCEELQG
ncbi:PREDICTED: taste receptor type 1 member 1 [Aptenodytes forsteri]|uniref:taste receptor type 1 member 1 n=1 Tax=Aptenodytes forsteri TaxID=9233 RepID=UPI0009051908|nr:PREDICTED: taste receptor type 1 member 1 [Aptenodytes forsteri]